MGLTDDSAAAPVVLAAGWLPQDPTLFAGTVVDNIRLGWPDAPESALHRRAAAGTAVVAVPHRPAGHRARWRFQGSQRGLGS